MSPLARQSRFVYEATLKDGGSTFEPLTGRFVVPGCRDGHSVALREGSALRVARDLEAATRLTARTGEALEVFGPHHIEQVVRAHRHVYSVPDTTLGTWLDGDGVVHIDPAEIVTDLGDAIRRASHRNQRAVYDLTGGVTVPVLGIAA